MMRALLMCDAGFAARERALLDRLAIGLMDEGVRVALAQPTPVGDEADGFVDRVAYDPPASGLTARHAARRLWRRLAERGIGRDRDPISLIHVFGQSAWSVGRRLGAALRAPIIIDAWSTAMVARAARRCPAGTPLSLPGDGLRPVAEALGVGTDAAVCRWGAHPSDTPPTRPGDVQPSAVVVANGSCRQQVRTALTGLARVAEATDALVICDAALMRHTPGLWRHARAVGLGARLTLIADLERRRTPALTADTLVAILEPGEHRSILLDAMAAGAVVVTQCDDACAWIRAGETACTLDPSADANAWAGVLHGALTRAEPALAVARLARDWVRHERPASVHITDTLTLYERVAGRVATPLTGP